MQEALGGIQLSEMACHILGGEAKDTVSILKNSRRLWEEFNRLNHTQIQSQVVTIKPWAAVWHLTQEKIDGAMKIEPEVGQRYSEEHQNYLLGALDF